MNALLVALGGALGTLLRYGMNVVCSERFGDAFPYATFAVNALGSFALGFTSYALLDRFLWGVPLGLIVGTGVLGGFTTYSAFNLETMRMVQHGQIARAAFYASVTFVTCLILGGLGALLGARLAR